MALNDAGHAVSEPLVPVLDAQGESSVARDDRRMSQDSTSSVSTTSLVFERINERLLATDVRSESHQRRPSRPRTNRSSSYKDHDRLSDFDDEDPLKEERNSEDLETGPFLGNGSGSATAGQRGAGASKHMDRGLRRLLLIIAGLLVAVWLIGLFAYIASKAYQHPSQLEHDPQATVSRGSGKQVTLSQIQSYFWYPESHTIQWISGANGEDGLLIEQGSAKKDFLVVEDVRAQNPDSTMVSGQVQNRQTLIKSGNFQYNGKSYMIESAIPSRNLQRVLVTTNVKSNWRHSSTGFYWVFDVATQTAEPLVPGVPDARAQSALWSPTSDAIVFTRDNNLFLRRVGSDKVIQITTDGGADVFNGVPDWVYEEEVLGGDSATWWSEDGSFIAFFRTNETGVPDYPVQYFVSRPSGDKPAPGEESYPEVRKIKYPKAGAHNPIVDLKFYDVTRGDVFSPVVSGGFADEDRLLTSVVWAGKQALVKETNRVSDVLRVVLIDPIARTGKAVRTVDVKSIDGGWFEISQNTRYIPADLAKGRPSDGYIDTVIYEDGDHLGYFTPLDNPDPIMLTSGKWEVDNAPSAIDLERNLVYFVGTKESSIQRHVYQVKLTGEDLAPITDTTAEAYYTISFSNGAGYALLSNRGPGIPWQKVISTPSNPTKYEHLVEDNKELAKKAQQHELPIKIYGTITVDGVELNYVERRPPHFNAKKKYPVLFHQYSGPGSQSVRKTFGVDFQDYVAAGLGYICVTVDGRGTGFIGRKNRVLVRKELGQWESHDQIAAAQIWAAKNYVDATRIAIWGWSFGGYMTLKTLEQDAGRTFRYGMAVAPVTDWRFYDSVYTERYMLTPQENAAGYEGAAISNTTALGENVRFLLMHGVADDNVHFQHSLTLLDKLDKTGVENYDVHVFPDSDHSIAFHNANVIVYDKLRNWLVNAFNGEWIKVAAAKPNPTKKREMLEAEIAALSPKQGRGV